MKVPLDPNDGALAVVTDGLLFPEGPVWSSDGSITVAEMVGKKVTRVDPDGTKTVIGETEGGPNGLARGPDGSFYICNNGGVKWFEEHGIIHLNGMPEHYRGGWIERMDPLTGRVERLFEGCGEQRLNSPNDIVFDRLGGFYFTDLGRSHPTYRDHGAVYYAHPDGSLIREVAKPFITPNGIGLSPAGDVLYVAETETCRLWAFDIVAPGVVTGSGAHVVHGGRIVCGLPGYQKFDSLAVDVKGNIHIATLLSGAVTVVSPDGTIVDTILTPDPMTTNVCFGGGSLDDAFITLSGVGQLVRRRSAVPGLPLN